ncbi:DUF6263 family protein [Chitinophaga eiseniae]|uniref:Uncharacterized protein n=1 Tax=Chitinophaga eiseniae TaxID=634771 RepID=A0A847SML4_9BACT|nr:DUF6263 family protein [Chitinophaga eiseniae]NLR78409.1 hypothetical protein [Chitinophaga eiseniae]
MLKQLKATAIIVLAICSACICEAQSGLLLNIKKGDKYLVEYKQQVSVRVSGQNPDSAFVFTTENIMSTVYEVLSANNNKYQVKATYLSVRFNSNPPAGSGNSPVQFDSDKPSDMEGEIGDPVKTVLGKSTTFTFDGTTKKLVSIDEDPGIQPENSQGGPELGLFFFNEDGLRAFAPKLLGGDLPADARIEVGYKWDQNNANNNSGMATKFERHSNISKIEPGSILVDVNQTVTSAGSPEGSSMTIDSKSTATGKKVIDRATGMLLESRFDDKGLIQTESEEGRGTTEKTTITTLTVKKM